jgi:hypothetical protein
MGRYKIHIIALLIVFFFSLASFFVVLNKLSPYNHTELAFLFFFLSVFIALFSGFSLMLFLLRLFLMKDNFYAGFFNISVRQGLLLSFLAVLILVLQLLRVLNWWTGLLVIALIAFLEYYFSYNESKYL